MSTKTSAKPEILLRPSDDGHRTKIRRRVVIAVLGLTAVTGGLLAVGAHSTRTSPAPVPARSQPAVFQPPHGPMVVAGCLAAIECYGESQLILNEQAPK